MGELHRLMSQVTPATYSSGPTYLSKYGYFWSNKFKMATFCKANMLDASKTALHKPGDDVMEGFTWYTHWLFYPPASPHSHPPTRPWTDLPQCFPCTPITSHHCTNVHFLYTIYSLYKQSSKKSIKQSKKHHHSSPAKKRKLIHEHRLTKTVLEIYLSRQRDVHAWEG